MECAVGVIVSVLGGLPFGRGVVGVATANLVLTTGLSTLHVDREWPEMLAGIVLDGASTVVFRSDANRLLEGSRAPDV